MRNIKIDRLPESDKNNTNPNGAEGLQKNNKKQEESRPAGGRDYRTA